MTSLIENRHYKGFDIQQPRECIHEYHKYLTAEGLRRSGGHNQFFWTATSHSFYPEVPVVIMFRARTLKLLKEVISRYDALQRFWVDRVDDIDAAALGGEAFEKRLKDKADFADSERKKS